METILRFVETNGKVTGIQVKFTQRVAQHTREVSLAFDVRPERTEFPGGQSETVYSVYGDCPVQAKWIGGHKADHDLDSLPHVLARLVGAQCIDE